MNNTYSLLFIGCFLFTVGSGVMAKESSNPSSLEEHIVHLLQEQSLDRKLQNTSEDLMFRRSCSAIDPRC